MKKIILIILIVLAAVAATRFATDEDTWICSGGEWVKHGNPSAPMPSSGCGNKNEKENRIVNLYYYSPEKDKDSSGNILCSRKGLVAVSRKIPLTQTPIQDAIKLLLEGELTSAEKSQGITTEFPLPGVELKGANLKEGVLTLEFSDPSSYTSGGSCRAGVLWFQIESTALQFEGVSSVRFSPDHLFQP